ncbi:GntR family transcriptional regulator [Lentilactobacillus sp. Marseille-Q4993]|uniref:GntR family transcriptional regulator n=1 Tax=Lentilactobacillus sp. Marseille-Q4993 TaxID=3039492 RepID=UPI0024BCB78A|nr:GntR family transcriptional regulator [Lentilactobacillus sp. Marseille-Q4993]
MHLLISKNSMVPIYEQIVNQIKKQMVTGNLVESTPLPSVRSVAKDQHISALTVKKAYDQLDSEGLITTVHGKGSFISKINSNDQITEIGNEIKTEFGETISKAQNLGLNKDQITKLFNDELEGK